MQSRLTAVSRLRCQRYNVPTARRLNLAASRRRHSDRGGCADKGAPHAIAASIDVGHCSKSHEAPARLEGRARGSKSANGTVDDPISLDELAALGADNKLLKRLLAELLLAQNLWLKKMLERFDAERDVAPLASGRKAREPEFRG